MSTGISIASINRIKELAEEKKFREALDILDTQNLDKSINPQFLKISGEIFRENKRYYDSRRILLKAHQMAPQGTRILAELIQLYLELGYFTKAKQYYEQYLFYVAPDDTQRDYIEYMVKKATGTDVNDLAAILIPILERMPEDRWNFEAILLYHKMDRKDLALEEARYILETFKESDYVYPVIDYVEDKLDVDYWFYAYPREEQPEDTILFGDLLEQEDKLLEEDYLRMHPPEARIVVEADDNDISDVKPVKEKLSKKRFGRKAKKKADESIADAVENVESADDAISKQDDSESKIIINNIDTEKVDVDTTQKAEQNIDAQSANENPTSKMEEKDGNDFSEKEEKSVNDVSADEHIKKEREEALKVILAKKIDKDKIKESAKNIAKAVKEIDTSKAKQQIYSVAENVKGNVKKATEAFNDVVGVSQEADVVRESVKVAEVEEDTILDGIIESVLEPPKQTVGQVITNEELDALIPDSLEAMSEQEIADIEAKREELNKLELEALEASLKLEEEKKAKKRGKAKDEVREHENQEQVIQEEIEDSKSEDTMLMDDASDSEQKVTEEEKEVFEEKTDEKPTLEDTALETSEKKNSTYRSTYEELKNKFIEETEEMKPLDSLGFISVVHSDIDKTMENQVPDAAGILKQMIDNKEFYSGEDSRKFEAEDSYEDHGFEVENFDFDVYRNQEETKEEKDAVSMKEEFEVESSPVQEIFVEEQVVAFEDVVSEEQFTSELKELQPEITEAIEEVVEEPVTLETESEPTETIEEVVEEPVILEVESEPTETIEEVVEEPVTLETESEPTETIEEVVEESVILEVESEPTEPIEEVVEEPVTLEVESEPTEPIEEVVEEPVTLEVESEPTETIEEVVEEPVILEVESEPTETIEEVVEEPVTLETESEPMETIEEVVEEPVTLETESEPTEPIEEVVEEPVTLEVESEPTETIEEVVEEPVTLEVESEPTETIEEVVEEPVILEVESEATETIEEVVEEPETIMTAMEETYMESTTTQNEFEQGQLFYEQFTAEVPAFSNEMPKTYMNEELLEYRREKIRTDIVLTIRMQNILLKLKESR